MRVRRGLSELSSLATVALLLRFPVQMPAQVAGPGPTFHDVANAGRGTAGSPYIPLDSWVYPAVLRLHELGYLPSLYVGMRPYTRVSLAHALSLSVKDISQDEVNFGRSDEAVEIFARLREYLAPEFTHSDGNTFALESSYTRIRSIEGFALNDSFHVGQTFVNDYGRTYQDGVNAIAGSSGYVTWGRFNLYLRGEYQHARSGQGYNSPLVQFFTSDDGLTPGYHAIIPQGTIPAVNQFRMINAEATVHLLGTQIGFGRTDNWLGPAYGGSMAWSTNAEPIYAFRIDRVEPMHIPFISSFAGLFRYEFFVGSLKGHDTPNDPWVHTEKVSFHPTADLEFGFGRTVIWGGKGHAPITIGTFFRSFFSPAGVANDVKFSRNDPGARFSTFDFHYRIPWHDHLLTIYTDSFVHDNVFPVSNPARAAFRPGVIVNRLAHFPQVDWRFEGAFTDIHDLNSVGGNFLFYEGVQKNGYTNRLFLLGDPIGREDKAVYSWLTWHIRADEDAQLEFRSLKAANDFVPRGTTQQNLALNVRLRPLPEFEVKGDLQGELFRGPAVVTGTQHTVGITFQLTYFPKASARPISPDELKH